MYSCSPTCPDCNALAANLPDYDPDSEDDNLDIPSLASIDDPDSDTQPDATPSTYPYADASYPSLSLFPPDYPPDVHPITGAPLLVSDITDPGYRPRTMSHSPDSLAPPHPLPDDPAILTLYGYLPLTCFRNGLDTCATCAKVAFGPPSYLQRLLSDALALIPPTHAAPSAPT
jgi:hypothetical protein